MRLLKLLTVVLALSSTVAFVVASRATARPLTAISAVQPAMNYAYVRLEGRVPSFPTLADGSLSFTVQDGSGDMRVTAYRAVADAISTTARVPMPGDLVTVEGTLRIRDDAPSLVINAPEAISVQSTEATAIRLAALDTMQTGERAQIIGQVRRIRDVSDSFKIVTLRQGSATADMALPLNLPAFKDVQKLAEGDWLRVTGGVGEFRGSKQLLPSSAQAIEKIQRPSDDAASRPITALDKSFIGQWVALRGIVDDLQPFKLGMRVVLRDSQGDQTITVVTFDRVWQSLPFSTTLAVGDMLNAQGELQDYRGALEIVPEITADVEIKK